VYATISRGVVFAYFASAAACVFMSSGADFLSFCKRAGFWLLPGWLALALGAAVMLRLWDIVEAIAERVARRIVDAPSLARSAALAVALVVFICTQIWDSDPAPVFVYRGF
jgi:hypothetical protein